MIRVGIIGCGFMGGMHAACYQALGVQVVAVADPRTEYAKEVAAKSGAAIYENGMALIEQAEVNVVSSSSFRAEGFTWCAMALTPLG